MSRKAKLDWIRAIRLSRAVCADVGRDGPARKPGNAARPSGRHRRCPSILQRSNAVLDAVGDLVDLLFIDNQGRRQDQGVSNRANKDPVFETMVRHGPRPLTGSIWRCFDLYGPKQSEVANIADHSGNLCKQTS
jgi:hypothetical protein